ncbi:hypothetical protein CK203_090327 [Vitis vinifera]|uniref:Uncharacterized protein n=1 Tax=Vitis vinifera TaxID=29760 RepID=A0A438EHY8_VITVI|nr:hypothetical protein CK203_090327 [Vitis vinifera]
MEADANSISCQFRNCKYDFVWILTKVYRPVLRGEREDFWKNWLRLEGSGILDALGRISIWPDSQRNEELSQVFASYEEVRKQSYQWESLQVSYAELPMGVSTGFLSRATNFSQEI